MIFLFPRWDMLIPWRVSIPQFAVVWPQELDLKNWKLIGERHYLWRGAMYGGVFVEGPCRGQVGPQGMRGTQGDTHFLFLLSHSPGESSWVSPHFVAERNHAPLSFSKFFICFGTFFMKTGPMFHFRWPLSLVDCGPTKAYVQTSRFLLPYGSWRWHRGHSLCGHCHQLLGRANWWR